MEIQELDINGIYAPRINESQWYRIKKIDNDRKEIVYQSCSVVHTEFTLSIERFLEYFVKIGPGVVWN